MKKYIEPNVKVLATASEELMAAASLELCPTPTDPADADVKGVEITSTCVWDE